MQAKESHPTNPYILAGNPDYSVISLLYRVYLVIHWIINRYLKRAVSPETAIR
jgi:hypothetical protein